VIAPELTVHVNRVDTAKAITPDEVERAVRFVTGEEGVARGEISVTFLDAATMSDLNETHLQHRGPTDVISFNLGTPNEPLGDIYVCPDLAADSARELRLELREELLRLVIHGTLHVLGHDHPEGADLETSEMYRLQEALLSHLI
jgi:probable rRNA maturation factor